jgi:hypothetical protein
MKIGGQRWFWSLRPTLGARVLEFGCWFAAGLLAVGLAIASGPTGSTPQPIGAIGAAQAKEALIFRSECIDRVLASDLGMTEESVVRKIKQQCTTFRRRATAAVPVSRSSSLWPPQSFPRGGLSLP